MILTILFWIGCWIATGLITQLAIRIVYGDGIFSRSEHYFWSAVAGPFLLIIWLVSSLFNRFTNLDNL